MRDEITESAEGNHEKNSEAEQLLQTLVGTKEQMDRYIKLMSIAADGRYFDAVQALQRTGNPTSALLDSLVAVRTAVETFPLEWSFRESVQQSRLYYREILERQLDQDNLGRSGQWPSYVIEDIIRLQVNLEQDEALIDGKRVGTIEPSRVVGRVRTRLDELFDESFEAPVFMDALRTAQKEIATDQSLSAGDYVDIRKVYGKIRSQVESGRYSEAKFGADLYRLGRDGRPKTSDGLVLELSPAQNASGGLYIPARGGGNYIAALRFVGGKADG